MDITIPSGQPAWRFMRYIRPPDGRTKLEPIYPLRPATRTIKLGIDVETVPEPPDGLVTGFLTREELLEVHLMVPNEEEAPATWTDLVPNAVILISASSRSAKRAAGSTPHSSPSTRRSTRTNGRGTPPTSSPCTSSSTNKHHQKVYRP